MSDRPERAEAQYHHLDHQDRARTQTSDFRKGRCTRRQTTIDLFWYVNRLPLLCPLSNLPRHQVGCSKTRTPYRRTRSRTHTPSTWSKALPNRLDPALPLLPRRLNPYRVCKRGRLRQRRYSTVRADTALSRGSTSTNCSEALIRMTLIWYVLPTLGLADSHESVGIDAKYALVA